MLASLIAAALWAQAPSQAPTSSPAPTPAPALPSWAEFEKDQLLTCASALEARTRPLERKIGQQIFVLEGSSVRRVGPVPDRVVIGLLSAIKEVDDDTRANLQTALAQFRQRQVDVIVVNGDLALDQFDLEDVMRQLGASGLPVFVLIGNSEGRGGFNRAFVAAEKDHPNLFNLNWQRHVDLGRVDLLSLPGYHDRVFMPQRSGCQYKTSALEELAQLAGTLHQEGRTPVLVGHGPPRSTGPAAIDLAHEAGHVGDPLLAQMLEDAGIHYGLFGHILEAGGRGCSNLTRGDAAKPGAVHSTLHVNVGSASATPWGMLDGRTSRGLAMVVSFEKKGARYEVLTLRR
ncbi:MAG: metallophosphoesterase [Pseudomonadota bacterium]